MEEMTRPTRRAAAFGLAALAAAPAARARPARADVLILGAGLSGLHAARLLEAEGFKVLVLEGSGRIGGRVVTLDDLPGAPNGGATQVGAGYARVRKTCADLSIALVPSDEADSAGAALSIRGRTFPLAEWAKAPENRLGEKFKTLPPQAILSRLAREANPLTDTAAWREPAAQAHDVSAASYLAAAGLNPEMIRLAEVSLNGNRLETYSMLNIWRTLTLFTQEREMGRLELLRDGGQRLPEAMANSLSGEIRTGVIVHAIEPRRRSVRARTNAGEFEAPFAIATMPFAALRAVKIEAPLPKAQRAAIDSLPYTQILQLHLEAETPFWEGDGLAAEMWTDGPLERIFPGRDRSGRSPNGLLLAWINGEPAAALAKKTDAELEALARAEFARLRPASEGRVRLRRALRWTAENPFAGGAYMHWAPGQIAAFAETMGAAAGRLHFAGEHLSYLHTGMEGAMESGERAALAILTEAGARR
jgi:monoamine oxidase